MQPDLILAGPGTGAASPIPKTVYAVLDALGRTRQPSTPSGLPPSRCGANCRRDIGRRPEVPSRIDRGLVAGVRRPLNPDATSTLVVIQCRRDIGLARLVRPSSSPPAGMMMAPRIAAGVGDANADEGRGIHEFFCVGSALTDGMYSVVCMYIARLPRLKPESWFAVDPGRRERIALWSLRLVRSFFSHSFQQ